MALARKPFVVIDAEILSSSVWSEAAHVRLVWITLLILCDTEGYVGAAIPGIARAAGVTLDEAREAMERLQQPDKDSRTQANEGRRVAIVPRGFQVLNFRDHLDRLSAERSKARDRVRRFRAKHKGNATVTPGNVSVTTGSREQGIGNSEQNGRTEASERPDDSGEKLLRDSRVALEREFYRLVSEIAKYEPDTDPPDIARTMSSYTNKDGAQVGGKMRPETLSDERLQRSIKDGLAWLEACRGKSA